MTSRVPTVDEVLLSPVSFAQERLWFLDRLDPGTPLYNVLISYTLRGGLNPVVLQRAFREIIRRHEILRTTFQVQEGSPVQVISSAAVLDFTIRDLTAAEDPEAESQRVADAERHRVFDITRAPLFRTILLRVSREEHVLLVLAHHIVFDGWSTAVLFHELSTLYADFSAGRPSSLPELPIQYADYAEWQRGKLQGPELESLLAFWTKTLDGAPQLLDLPTDRPRPAVQAFGGARHWFTLDKGLTARIKELCRREGVTLYTVLLALFETMLFRYSGREDLLVGCPVAGRLYEQTEPLIGLFVNTLVLRGDLSGDPSFRELLRRTREMTLGALAHQDLPFEKLVQAIKPERSRGYSPLVQVALTLENTPPPALALGELTAVPFYADARTAKFDLALHVAEQEGTLRANLEYDTALFDPATVSRMAANFRTLTEDAVADPGRPLSRLSLLSEEERRRLVSEYGTPSPVSIPPECLHRRFEVQAAKTPEAAALEFEGARLTYGELNARANRLAHLLRDSGVGPEVFVPLYLSRGFDLIVAILAVLKAGGAYVPLDPRYPRDRIAFMLEDCGASLVVTQQSLADRLPNGVAKILSLDADADAIARQSPENPDLRNSVDSAAYVIYTSGSTGEPKGVVVTHANVDRLLTQTEPWYGFGERDVWSLFHSCAFDFSVWEIWGALRYGGRLVVVPYWVSRSPEAFEDLLSRTGVTVLNQTPSAFRQLLEADRVAPKPLALRLVIFGGEALEPELLRPWLDVHGEEDPRLVNMYGITETTVHVTYHPVTRRDLEQPWASVIGRPIPDLKLYVLDSASNLCPIGVPGELFVGGSGVARGYWNRPKLTTARFLEDPFSHEPGSRLYRTGDRVRYRPDGELEYLGRLDHQVKIRGFRIELGEIETALARCPGVEEVVVVPSAGPDGERLIACLRLAPVSDAVLLSPRELRACLSLRLPDPMIPSAFVWLREFPRLPNGKIDRLALASVDLTGSTPAEQYVAPRTPVEETLARVFGELLDSDPVGVEDNFFERGGHSLLAVRLASRVRDAFGVEIPLETIFQRPTISGLAAAVAGKQAERMDSGELASLLAELEARPPRRET